MKPVICAVVVWAGLAGCANAQTLSASQQSEASGVMKQYNEIMKVTEYNLDIAKEHDGHDSKYCGHVEAGLYGYEQANMAMQDIIRIHRSAGVPTTAYENIDQQNRYAQALWQKDYDAYCR